MRPRPVELARVLKKTGSSYYRLTPAGEAFGMGVVEFVGRHVNLKKLQSLCEPEWMVASHFSRM